MPDNESQRHLSSIAVTADEYGVSTKTIRRWITQGLLKAYRVGPRLIKVDLDDVDQLLQPVGGEK